MAGTLRPSTKVTRAWLTLWHDVLVGEQVAVGRHHDTGTGAAARLCGLVRAADVDAHDGRPDFIDGADDGGGVGIQGIGRELGYAGRVCRAWARHGARLRQTQG